MSMNTVMREVMAKHNPHVHQTSMRTPGNPRRKFHYSYDESKVNGVYDNGAPPVPVALVATVEAPPAPPSSEWFIVSRVALSEAHSALAGAVAVLGDVANLSHAMTMLKTARGGMGDAYAGH
jgi:hypothetical protein